MNSMATKRIITGVNVKPQDVPEMLRNCHTAKTWRPRALGLFGTENRGVMVQRLESGVLTLPNRNVNGMQMPDLVFEPEIRGHRVSPARLAIYDMFDTPSLGEKFSNGRLYFIVSATIPNYVASQLQNHIEIPAAELHDRLTVNKAAYNHMLTSISLLAVEEYTQHLEAAIE